MSALNREWSPGAHGPVERLDEGLLSVAGEIAMPLGRFPRRMTAVALTGGRSAIWSGIALDPEALDRIEALGAPAFLVVPGVAHRLDAAAWLARFPALQVLCARGAIEAVVEAVPVSHTADPFGDPAVRFETVPGTGGREGALQVTRGGRTTLVINDVLANVRNPRGLGAKVMARLFGFGVARPQMPRPVRNAMVEDARALARAFRRWAQLPGLARIVVSHGEVIEHEPRAVCERMAAELGG